MYILLYNLKIFQKKQVKLINKRNREYFIRSDISS